MTLGANAVSRFRQRYQRSFRRSNTRPELVELPRIEECDGFEDLAFLHLKLPSVGVVIRSIILRRGRGLEQNDHHVPVGIKPMDSRNQRRCHVQALKG
jgi:hypothetical protein